MRPILLITSGQSNMATHPAFTWTPPANLMLWNWDGGADTDIGTGFAPISGSMGVAYSLGAELALQFPDRTVHIVNISKGGQPIEKWLSGGGSPDMFTALSNNVTAALAVIGTEVEMRFAWWQGEANVTAIHDNSMHLAKFAAFRARLKATSWFPAETPMLVFGISPYVPSTQGLAQSFNGVLQLCAAVEPGVISYVNTGDIPIAAWDSASGPYAHMLADGYRRAGRLGHLAWSGQARRALGKNAAFHPDYGYLQSPNPAFMATFASGTGPAIVAPYNSMSLNSGGDFDYIAGAFTAPVDGTYVIGYKIGKPATDGALSVLIQLNSADVLGSQSVVTKASETTSFQMPIYMGAGDAVRLHLTAGTVGGGANNNCFWGHLI